MTNTAILGCQQVSAYWLTARLPGKAGVTAGCGAVGYDAGMVEAKCRRETLGVMAGLAIDPIRMGAGGRNRSPDGRVNTGITVMA